MNVFTPGTRVFFWNSFGTIKYGEIKATERLGGTLLVRIAIDKKNDDDDNDSIEMEDDPADNDEEHLVFLLRVNPIILPTVDTELPAELQSLSLVASSLLSLSL
ncbi:hypothetical protein SCLCIDRAFT_31899 [Scleroderma citrinum Foug A]|uniref:Uncharacterized protein n=1 Tax=Scleroderma citrinum Foug A TaxID=1036808 RepID=A0A0C3CXX4_9AGAM|nr:hypothetical protein SCLCIDRAFT_31899 [Scleroderma citrinum Foug A]